ncbi:hypothetical protein QTP86_002349 [Hemibagrus guttatus]|nr:hypothetical protein QTP86_002349 [Hemibagrus guttatus]
MSLPPQDIQIAPVVGPRRLDPGHILVSLRNPIAMKECTSAMSAAMFRKAKRDYSLRLEGYYTTADSWHMWQGLQHITEYRQRSQGDITPKITLPDELNEFYARFEAPNTGQQHNTLASESILDTPLTVSSAEVCMALRKTNPPKAAGPDNIPGRALMVCSLELANVLTDIYNLSLTQALAKQKAYEELYTRLDTREGEKDLYRLARQRDRDGKDVQQVRVIKDRDGRVLTSEESVQRRWKEYFEELMNEENEREKRVEGVNSVEQKVDKIRKDEVRKALKRMKSGKAVGPDDIPVEVWKCLGEAAVEFLANLFNRVLESERMPEEWRRSVLVPIFKNKGDVQSCSNYRGIKLMSHTMKVWERVVEARLRKVVEICEQQYGFMPRKSTTDAIVALRILMEKYRDGQKELHCVFVDLEKAYDRVPREELWYCMRKSGVAEKYVRVVQDMYERSRTVVRCAVGQTEEFNVEVGLHQGSALSPFLFAIVMDQLSEEVRQESPWTMMFADDIVICSESREQVEENLERWRFALERRGMKVSRSKTEYMCVNEREGSGTVRLQGEEVKKVQEFKYLGSTVQSNGECGKEVKKRVQAGWNGWRKVSGVLCDQKISARIKGKVYRTVVRPAMLYGLETVSLRKRQESELEVAELKMLRFSLGVTRLDRIRNEYIRGTAHVGRLGDKVREARLRWFGHVQRRDKLADTQNYYPTRIKIL